MPTLRAAFILAAFLAITLILIPFQWLLLTLRLPARRTFPHRYHRLVAQLFGIRVRVVGTPPRGATLILANHSSWLDIVTFSSVIPLSFIAKSEVGTWPFFGTLARLQRTVFVTRARRSETGQARDAIAERLKEGDVLVLFPEGTSSDGNVVLPFKSALLSAAAVVLPDGRSVPVQPVSSAYVAREGIPMGRENRPFYAWYGDMELVPHLWEALKSGPLDVVMQFHEPLPALDRKELAGLAWETVRKGHAQALAGLV
ncbi:MAG TPA: lysophospholipid acyltransferase family protein [Rhizomicrobium sp.]|jgi:1-acyl-sn-glycerol-3-phosphate acyltransferase